MGDETPIDPALAGLQNQEHIAVPVAPMGPAPVAPMMPMIHPYGDILKDGNLAVERAQTWTGISRFGFNAMLGSADYKNKLRLKPDKMERIVHFLTTPDAKSREKDRGDAQTKHQAQQWVYQDSILYRKESRLQQPRRHINSDEVFDILTAEHLLSGHQGRDKMLKVLEAKYIGYTKDELMAVQKPELDSNRMEIAVNATRVDQVNYLGATIFWFYIIAALFFTGLVIRTLLEIKQTDAAFDVQKERNVLAFSLLAALSFATLSVNMLNVLAQSFNSWSQRSQPQQTNEVLPAIWKWSLTSTLFRDFGEAVVENSARYLWSEAALFMTFAVCLFVGIEGSRCQVPRLWAFFCLTQILPISFTQNLFYVALLRLNNYPLPTRVSTLLLRRLIFLTGAYCGSLFILPMAAGGTWLMPLVLFSRVLLFAPLFATSSATKQSNEEELTHSEMKVSGFQTSIALLPLLCLLVQFSVTVLDHQNPSTIGWALFEHPAVSSLGCDLAMSLISAAMWLGKSKYTAKGSQDMRKTS